MQRYAKLNKEKIYFAASPFDRNFLWKGFMFFSMKAEKTQNDRWCKL